MIKVNKLAKSYGDFVAVHDVSFTAEKGEVVGFLGPNGAGKTTTIRMLSTFLPPSSGSATIAGFDVVEQADEVRRRIGYLPENPPLYNEMTVAEYLKFVAQIKAVPRARVRESVEQALERCFITNVRGRLCGHLSRGYRQRVGLAQALIHDPEVLILDEPTSGLDPKQITEIRELIASLRERHTVIICTHILPEVTVVCSKVVIINRGRIALEQQLDQLTQGQSLESVFLNCVSSEEQAARGESVALGVHG